jgi:hypothetical protein
MAGFWNTLGSIVAPETTANFRGQREAEAAAKVRAARQAEVQGLLDRVAPGGDPAADEKRLLLMSNLDAYTNAQAENYKPRTIPGGDTGIFGNGIKPYTAPKMEVKDGVATTLTPGGPTSTSVLPMGQKDAADAARETRKVDAQIAQFAQTYGLDERELEAKIKSGWFRKNAGGVGGAGSGSGAPPPPPGFVME